MNAIGDNVAFFDVSLNGASGKDDGCDLIRRLEWSNDAFSAPLRASEISILKIDGFVIEAERGSIRTGFTDTLCIMPSLRALAIQNCVFRSPQSQKQLFFPRLRFLSITVASACLQTCSFVGDLFVRCGHALEVLHLGGNAIEDVIAGLTSATKLSHLVLDAAWWTNKLALRALRLCQATRIWPVGMYSESEAAIFLGAIAGMMARATLFWPQLSGVVSTSGMDEEVQALCKQQTKDWRGIECRSVLRPRVLTRTVRWQLEWEDLA